MDQRPEPETFCKVCGHLEWYINAQGGCVTVSEHRSCKRELSAPYRALSRRGVSPDTIFPLSYIVLSDTNSSVSLFTDPPQADLFTQRGTK